MKTTKQRVKWVDCTKVLACILVVLGHFFMSMTESEIISYSYLQSWFIRTIYYIHVPLFLICSGYLYQEYTVIQSFSGWRAYILRKVFDLVIPYFAFSTITWILKYIFSNSVNTQNDKLLSMLFLQPISPYWYLYILFFVFLITPIFKTKKQAIIGVLCVVFLFFIDFSDTSVKSIYALTQTSHQIIWFVIGMCISVWKMPDRCTSLLWRGIGFTAVCAFVLMSFVTTKYSYFTELGMGILGCAGILLTINNLKFRAWFEHIVVFFAKYTMPIFLMHTIFAAGMRTILLKCRIEHVYTHVFFGITVSLLGPIITSIIMERCKLDFVIYPRKLLKALMWAKDKD